MKMESTVDNFDMDSPASIINAKFAGDNVQMVCDFACNTVTAMDRSCFIGGVAEKDLVFCDGDEHDFHIDEEQQFMFWAVKAMLKRGGCSSISDLQEKMVAAVIQTITETEKTMKKVTAKDLILNCRLHAPSIWLGDILEMVMEYTADILFEMPDKIVHDEEKGCCVSLLTYADYEKYNGQDLEDIFLLYLHTLVSDSPWIEYPHWVYSHVIKDINRAWHLMESEHYANMSKCG